MAKQEEYSVKVGFLKSLKKTALVLVPVLLAFFVWFQTNCNMDVTVFAGTGLTLGVLVNMIVNYLKMQGKI